MPTSSRATYTRDSGDETELSRGDALFSFDYMRQRRNHFVSYEVFLEFYWGHFPQDLTRSFGKFFISSQHLLSL